jgi:hypothetical protein
VGGRRVIEFYNTPFATQEQNAIAWKSEQENKHCEMAVMS